MQIEPIAVFHSPISGKFGVPRQAGLAGGLRGTIELTGEYRRPDALRGLDGFDYLWLIWNFNLNYCSRHQEGPAEHKETVVSKSADNCFKATVRPPRLGGNERIGVFASRSPFRPNGLGLSSVKIESIDFQHCTIEVSGADLADGTPIFDIKPYVEYADSHPGVRSGFVDERKWEVLEVSFADCRNAELLSEVQIKALSDILSLDPRPAYKEDNGQVYGLNFAGRNIRFKVQDGSVTVLDISDTAQP